jgi:hypothetical protein
LIAVVIAMTSTFALLRPSNNPPLATDFTGLRQGLLKPKVEGLRFRVEGLPEALASLPEAIAFAPNHSTIVIEGEGEQECDSIRIQGKALRIMALNEGKVFLKAKPISAGTKEPFIATDSDLVLSGLRLESSRSGTLESPLQSLIYNEKGKLMVHACSLRSNGTSACIVAPRGEIQVLNSFFRAEEGFALAGTLQRFQLKMQNSLIMARDCLELMSDERNVGSQEEPPSAIFSRCTIMAELAVRIIRKSEPATQISIDFSNSILDCERQIEVSALLPRRNELLNNSLMLEYLGLSLKLRMNTSIFSSEMDFFGASPLRNQSRRNSGIVSKWSEWASRFEMSENDAIRLDLDTMRRPFPSKWDLSTAPKAFQECGFHLE